MNGCKQLFKIKLGKYIGSRPKNIDGIGSSMVLRNKCKVDGYLNKSKKDLFRRASIDSFQ